MSRPKRLKSWYLYLKVGLNKLGIGLGMDGKIVLYLSRIPCLQKSALFTTFMLMGTDYGHPMKA